MPHSPKSLRKKLRKSWRWGRLINTLSAWRGARILVDCGDLKFFVDRRDRYVGRSLRKTGAYEPEEFARIAALITPVSDVLFVGAHIGALAIPTARLCRQIAMVEANPDTFELLSANCALNALSNCDLHNFAAGEVAGSIPFVKNTHNSGGSKRQPLVADDLYYYDQPEITEVPTKFLDEVFEDREFDLAVMDIEGSEYFALQGMQRILQTLPVLIVEFVPHHLSNVAGVTVAEFLRPILSHFTSMTVPSLGQTVAGDEVSDLLNAMYEAGQADGGLIFKKR